MFLSASLLTPFSPFLTPFGHPTILRGDSGRASLSPAIDTQILCPHHKSILSPQSFAVVSSVYFHFKIDLRQS